MRSQTNPRLSLDSIFSRGNRWEIDRRSSDFVLPIEYESTQDKELLSTRCMVYKFCLLTRCTSLFVQNVTK